MQGAHEIGATIMIEVAGRNASSLPRMIEPACEGGDRREPALAVATKEEESSCILSSRNGGGGVEVLVNHQIVGAGEVEIGHGNPEDGRELSLLWEEVKFEVFATVEQDHGTKKSGFVRSKFQWSFPEKVLNGGRGKPSERGVGLTKLRKPLDRPTPVPDGKPTPLWGMIVGLNHAASRPLNLFVIESAPTRFGRVPPIVAPVSGDQIQSSIAIKVSRRDAIPPAGKIVKPSLRGTLTQRWNSLDHRVPSFQGPLLVSEDHQGHPMSGHNQFGKSIVVQMGKSGRSHEAQCVIGARESGVGGEGSLLVAEQVGWLGAGVTSGLVSAADE